MADSLSLNDVSSKQPDCIVIPTVPAFDWENWDSAGSALRQGRRLEYGQSWFAEPEADFKPGTVWMGIQGEDLVVYAVMRDDAPRNRAVSLNEPTWTTGDVVEMFFQAEGRIGYYEFHVTPENQRLQLFFPSTADFRLGKGIRHWSIEESKFESRARVTDDQHWEILMRIKLSLVFDEPREDKTRRFRFMFGRYDYVPGRENPVTSATARMTKSNFHHIPEWDWAVAAE